MSEVLRTAKRFRFVRITKLIDEAGLEHDGASYIGTSRDHSGNADER